MCNLKNLEQKYQFIKTFFNKKLKRNGFKEKKMNEDEKSVHFYKVKTETNEVFGIAKMVSCKIRTMMLIEKW